ncbi:MAG TPA: FAD-dependent monooxygenase [Micromonosporaceae bacterium]|nr:FAD-dependent monooxygenase [Micromonosporaceae bacterium]
MTLNVLVAGGGLGGLCLAQGLCGEGINVRVFERDPTADIRAQGYRLRIDDHGVTALSRCLPGDLFQLFHATTTPPSPPRGAVFDHDLQQIESIGTSLGRTEQRRRRSTVANRATLRQILLAGLDDTVEFDREVVAARTVGDGVEVRFANGQVATGDILVAADGCNSAVRAQLLPHAQLLDSGLRSIYSRAILDEHVREVLPDVLGTGSPRVIGPGGVTLALGTYCPRESPQRAAARIAPYARLSHVPDYLKFALVAPLAAIGLTEAELWAASPTALYDIACRVTADWHPAVAELVRCADPLSTFALSIRAAPSVDPWPTTRITLLGDAIHATTPAGGTGANLALRDAALLTEYLAAVDRGRLGVLDAIAAYEDQMRDYGFAAATYSMRSAEFIFEQVPAALV